MKNKISVYQEHGDALCLKDGAFTITFFPEQVSFVEIENGYTMKIRPSLVETNIDKEDFLRLQEYSAQPTAQWLYRRAKSALSEFARSNDDPTLIEKEWKKLKKEIDQMLKK
jgi:hypothetical protein